MTGSSSFWFANPGSSFYNDVVTRSLKIDDGTDARLSRTLGTATNRARYTLSWWMKLGNTPQTGTTACIFDSGTNGANYSFIYLSDGRKLACNGVAGGGNNYALGTDDMIRDPNTWYHCMFVYNSSASTASDRIYFIVNGTRLTSTTGSPIYPTQSSNDPYWNNSNIHYIGYGGGAVGVGDFDGYLADIYHIDGQALDADSFTETKNGTRIPIEYSGSYGNNGFHIAFASGTGTGTASSSTIGADTSGNDLHFTTTNIASNDVMLDCPENNFCTWSPILGSSTGSSSGAASVLSEGNLDATNSGEYYGQTRGTWGVKSGKWYVEYYIRAAGYPSWSVGWTKYPSGLGVYSGSDDATIADLVGFGYFTGSDVYLTSFGSTDVNETHPAWSGMHSAGDAPTGGDIIGCAIDFDNGKVFYHVNGEYIDVSESSAGAGNPVTGANPSESWTASSFADEIKTVWYVNYEGGAAILNCGQDSTFNGNKTAGTNTDGNGFGLFQYAVPSGYLALCTRNVDDSTLGPNSDELANKHFIPYLYTADNTDNKARTGVGFQPDLLWIKCRDTAFSPTLYDSSRGANKYLLSSSSGAEVTSSDLMSSFDSDGFTTQTDSSSGNVLNYSSDKYVAWSWHANAGTTTTNDASATSVGTIDSVYQANTTAGFSIITYTGDENGGSIAHGLSAKPDFILFKSRDTSDDWGVYHSSIGASNSSSLNSTAGLYGYTLFSNTEPTSSVITLGASGSVGRYRNNKSSTNYVAYCWHNVDGFSHFGLYYGNGSTHGPVVDIGFKPALLVVKNRDTTGWWAVTDSARHPFNEIDNTLDWSGSYTESSLTSDLNVDFLSNGFKIRDTDGYYNTSGAEYIYMAWAELPFKYANAF